MARHPENQGNLPGVPPPKPAFYKGNIQYIAPNGHVRTGTLAVEAENIEDAKEKLETLMREQSWNNPRISKITSY